MTVVEQANGEPEDDQRINCNECEAEISRAKAERLNEFVTLYEGNCLDVLPLLTGIDAVFTSPPYNLGGEPWPHLGNWKPGDSAGSKSKWRNGSDAGAGIQYSQHADTMPWAEYRRWQMNVLSSLWELLPEDGVIFYNHKPRVIGARLWTPLELIPPEVVVRQIVIWARSGGVNFNPTAYLPTHEWVMVLAKPGFRLRDRAASGIGDVWNVPQKPSADHPAPFPIALPIRAIQGTDKKVWLDPFAGSGTTGVAAMFERRRCILIERDPAYCDVIRRRIEQTSGDGPGTLLYEKQPLLVEDMSTE